ncbi:MAG: class I SAM-dependent methyltransferase, partial [Kofleriaceae bacterium]
HADHSVRGVVGFYAIVHTPTAELGAAFRELARVLAIDGLLALAFHVEDETRRPNIHVDELFGAKTSLDFYFHDPDEVTRLLAGAGFTLEARLDREPYAGAEHPSRRSYLLARR